MLILVEVAEDLRYKHGSTGLYRTQKRTHAEWVLTKAQRQYRGGRTDFVTDSANMGTQQINNELHILIRCGGDGGLEREI